MASVTFIQKGGTRGVTGQTVEAFWNSISHVPLLSVGMNCALGPEEMRPLIEELCQTRADLRERLSECRACRIRCCRRAFPRRRNRWRRNSRSGASAGIFNIVGGCCGTTPPHIAKDRAKRCAGIAPRVVPTVEPYLR